MPAFGTCAACKGRLRQVKLYQGAYHCQPCVNESYRARTAEQAQLIASAVSWAATADAYRDGKFDL